MGFWSLLNLKLKDKSLWQSGHEYSGEIGMKDSFTLVQLPSGFRYNMFDKYMNDIDKRETIKYHNLDRIRNKEWIEKLLSKETEPKTKRAYQKRIKEFSKEKRVPKTIIPEKYQKWCKQIYELRDGDIWGPALAIEVTGSFNDK